jgi:hypothetical protein
MFQASFSRLCIRRKKISIYFSCISFSSSSKKKKYASHNRNHHKGSYFYNFKGIFENQAAAAAISPLVVST